MSMKSVPLIRGEGIGNGEAAAAADFLSLFFGFHRKNSGHRRERLWESGKPAFGFPLFHRREAGLWECGNLAFFARFPRDGGKSGKAAFAFPLFPRARHFHSPPALLAELRRR